MIDFVKNDSFSQHTLIACICTLIDNGGDEGMGVQPVTGDNYAYPVS